MECYGALQLVFVVLFFVSIYLGGKSDTPAELWMHTAGWKSLDGCVNDP